MPKPMDLYPLPDEHRAIADRLGVTAKERSITDPIGSFALRRCKRGAGRRVIAPRLVLPRTGESYAKNARGAAENYSALYGGGRVGFPIKPYCRN
jgi:hypothetical protein